MRTGRILNSASHNEKKPETFIECNSSQSEISWDTPDVRRRLEELLHLRDHPCNRLGLACL
jgi:hypothetical protein